MTLPDYITEQDTGFPCEHYFQRPGRPRRFVALSRVSTAPGRVPDEPIGPRAPVTMTVVRETPVPRPKQSVKRCEMCEEEYTANVPRQRYCGKAHANAASKARRGAMAS